MSKCTLGLPGAHHRICGAPYRRDGQRDAVVDCICQECGDSQTVPAFGQVIFNSKGGKETIKTTMPVAQTKLQKHNKIEADKEHIIATWRSCGNIVAAARQLGIKKTTLNGCLLRWGVLQQPWYDRKQQKRLSQSPVQSQVKVDQIVNQPPDTWPAMPPLLTEILYLLPPLGKTWSCRDEWIQFFTDAVRLLYKKA